MLRANGLSAPYAATASADEMLRMTQIDAHPGLVDASLFVDEGAGLGPSAVWSSSDDASLELDESPTFTSPSMSNECVVFAGFAEPTTALEPEPLLSPPWDPSASLPTALAAGVRASLLLLLPLMLSLDEADSEPLSTAQNDLMGSKSPETNVRPLIGNRQSTGFFANTSFTS